MSANKVLGVRTLVVQNVLELLNFISVTARWFPHRIDNLVCLVTLDHVTAQFMGFIHALLRPAERLANSHVRCAYVN